MVDSYTGHESSTHPITLVVDFGCRTSENWQLVLGAGRVKIVIPVVVLFCFFTIPLIRRRRDVDIVHALLYLCVKNF